MNADKREETNLQSFLGPEETEVAGLELRPLSLGSFALLRQIKSEFLSPRGEEMEVEIGGRKQTQRGMENEVLAVAQYVYLHAGPLKDVRRQALRGVEDFNVAALEFADRISFAELPGVISVIESKLAEVEAAHFETLEKPGDDKPEPGAPPKS